MKAALIRTTGGPEVIDYGDVPQPVPTGAEVLVRVGAVAVNPIDTYLRSGAVAMKLPMPFIIGCDLAGEVMAVGPEARRFQVGDRVWGSNQGLLGRQGTFAEYAAWRGFVIDAALPRHATGKPHVERNVQYLRESFFRGETFLDLAHVQREVIRWCTEVAGQRTHGTTRQRPLAVFLDAEKPALRPLERPRFDPPSWAECKVHGDHHVQFQKALYSVPTRHVGKSVWVRGDAKLVRIYVDGECVKTHERVREGGRSTDFKDYPAELAPYAMRDPEAVIREARRVGEHVGRFAEQLLAGRFPWAKLRQAQKLLRLANKYGRARLDVACRRAVT